MNLLSALFQSDDVIYLTDDVRGNPSLLRVSDIIDLSTHQFFAANPVSINWADKNYKTARHGLNVTSFRNFVFESDSEALDVQLEKWLTVAAKFPICTLTYSGGKSYHAIISLQDSAPFVPGTDAGLLDYSRAWRALALHLTELGAPHLDSSTKDPARLTRTPGGLRWSEQLRASIKQQAISNIELGKYLPYSDLAVLITKLPEPNVHSKVKEPINYENILDFDRSLKSINHFLHDKLRYPHTWAASTNMYPELFRLTLWTIDCTGVSETVLLNYLRLHTFPTILSKGYPRDLEVAVRNAYLWRS